MNAIFFISSELKWCSQKDKNKRYFVWLILPLFSWCLSLSTHAFAFCWMLTRRKCSGNSIEEKIHFVLSFNRLRTAVPLSRTNWAKSFTCNQVRTTFVKGPKNAKEQKLKRANTPHLNCTPGRPKRFEKQPFPWSILSTLPNDPTVSVLSLSTNVWEDTPMTLWRSKISDFLETWTEIGLPSLYITVRRIHFAYQDPRAIIYILQILFYLFFHHIFFKMDFDFFHICWVLWALFASQDPYGNS